MDLIPFHSDHVFSDHVFLLIFYYCIFFVLKCRICRFCRMYIHTGEKKIKSLEQKKKKFFIYINTKHTTFPTFPPFLYIFCTIFTVIYPKIFKKLWVRYFQKTQKRLKPPPPSWNRDEHNTKFMLVIQVT